jgi:hypothetical protein
VLFRFGAQSPPAFPLRGARRRVRVPPAGDVVFHPATGMDGQAITTIQASVRRRLRNSFVRGGLLERDDARAIDAWRPDAKNPNQSAFDLILVTGLKCPLPREFYVGCGSLTAVAKVTSRRTKCRHSPPTYSRSRRDAIATEIRHRRRLRYFSTTSLVDMPDL